jgi:hypothetical protein
MEVVLNKLKAKDNAQRSLLNEPILKIIIILYVYKLYKIMGFIVTFSYMPL